MKPFSRVPFALFCSAIMMPIACAGSSELTDDGFVTVGVYADSGAADACVIAAKNMFEWMGYTVFLMDADFINNEDLQNIDIFYFPGGSPAPYSRNITDQGREQIRKMIRSGSGFIGTCAGGLFAAETQVWHGVEHSQGQLGIFPGTATGPIPDIFEYPEIGMCQVDLHGEHPISDIGTDSLWIMFYNGPCFIPKPGSIIYTIGTYTRTGDIALAACEYGRGRVFLTGPHPEWEEDNDRDDISYFDDFDDLGSDWPLMRNAMLWCLHQEDYDCVP